jgi:hypothetical protein
MTENTKWGPEGETETTTAPSTVWVCAYDHRHGTDLWACSAEEVAFSVLAAVCRESWQEALQFDRHSTSGEGDDRLPAVPPDDDRTAVELYFAVTTDLIPPETYLIERHGVIRSSGREGSR